MELHEELRRARQEARLSQHALAVLAGIPRNQIVRAERGGNLTIDTLRKIAAHLPVNHLPLIAKKTLEVELFAEPEKTLRIALDNVLNVVATLRSATDIALEVARAAYVARGVPVTMNPLADGGDDPSTIFYLRRLLETAKEAHRLAQDAKMYTQLPPSP